MDYKYIEQLLERYWQCETSLEEERILRAFFSQEDIPASLRAYKGLFTCAAEEKKGNVLGSDFDRRIIALTEGSTTVKARKVSLTRRLAPLLKAAAIVVLIIMVGNAAQIALEDRTPEIVVSIADPVIDADGRAVAKNDSVLVDTLKNVTQTRQTLLIE